MFLTAAAVLAIGACSTDPGVRATGLGPADSTPSTSPTTPDVDPLEWGACTDEAADDPVLECALLKVPLNYDDPAGATIDIALVRAPATAEREGAVLFNPGGPGGSGFEAIAQSGTVIQTELGLEHFDIVGFDPRGVDRSGGIECVDDEFMDAHLYLDDTPDTPEEQELLDEDESGFTDGCATNYGDTLGHYSTASTARDMDMVRAGLGDEQISYIGISYGTYLGGVYATLFPHRVRAMVLDSAYEPNGDTVEQQYLTQIVGFENAFEEWAQWCEGDTDCAFHATDVGARWDALKLQLDEEPLITADGRKGNQAVLEVATKAALYARSQWPVLAAALADAEEGEPAGIFSMADEYMGRHPDGTFDSLFQSIGVILCASGIEDQPPPDPEALLTELQEQAPRFAADVTLEDLQEAGEECDELMEDQPVVELSYQGEGPIVVVGGTNDPATPLRWAEEMDAELGPNSRLVTFTGEGHGQLLASTCVTDIEAAVLAERTLPEEGTVCDPDPVVERPSWWDDLPVPEGVSDVVALPAVNAALGLTDTFGYGETRTTSMGARAALDAYGEALADAGFAPLGEQDIGIDDALNAAWFTPDGAVVILVVMGPAAFDTEDLASAKASVPEGKTVILLAYVPE